MHRRNIMLMVMAGGLSTPLNASALTETMWECRAERTLPGGTVYGVRSYRQNGQLYGGDSLFWNATGYDPAKPRAPIEWNLSFPWSAALDEPLDARRIKLAYRLNGTEPLPEVMLLHIQRPMPVEPHGIIGSTALTTLTFRYSTGYPTGGQGDLPLGDLLAYAGSYDTLGWHLTDRHDQYGHPRRLAEGTLSIAALREAVSAFRDLRRELVRKGKSYRKACELREVFLPPRHP